MRKRLLIDEHPLLVQPTLAKILGINEAHVLQQIHYWVQINEQANKAFHDGFYWTFGTYKEWIQQMPWFSEMTLRRTMASLESKGLLISGEFNDNPFNRTRWYRINELVLDDLMNEVCPPPPTDIDSSRSVQNEHLHATKMNTSNKETYQETKDQEYTSPKQVKDCFADMPKSLYSQETAKQAAHRVIKLFFESYAHYLKKEHPRLKSTQLQTVQSNLTAFLDDTGLDTGSDAEFTELISLFFNDPSLETSYNINHFASPGLLLNMYYHWERSPLPQQGGSVNA